MKINSAKEFWTLFATAHRYWSFDRICESRGAASAQKIKAIIERAAAKQTTKKANRKRNLSKALRKAAIAAAKASKYGWPTAPRSVQSFKRS